MIQWSAETNLRYHWSIGIDLGGSYKQTKPIRHSNYIKHQRQIRSIKPIMCSQFTNYKTHKADKCGSDLVSFWPCWLTAGRASGLTTRCGPGLDFYDDMPQLAHL